MNKVEVITDFLKKYINNYEIIRLWNTYSPKESYIYFIDSLKLFLKDTTLDDINIISKNGKYNTFDYYFVVYYDKLFTFSKPTDCPFFNYETLARFIIDKKDSTIFDIDDFIIDNFIKEHFSYYNFKYIKQIIVSYLEEGLFNLISDDWDKIEILINKKLSNFEN